MCAHAFVKGLFCRSGRVLPNVELVVKAGIAAPRRRYPKSCCCGRNRAVPSASALLRKSNKNRDLRSVEGGGELAPVVADQRMVAEHAKKLQYRFARGIIAKFAIAADHLKQLIKRTLVIIACG